MKGRWIAMSLAAGAMLAAPVAVTAQEQPPQQAPATKSKQKAAPQPANPDPDVEELTPSQIRRAQDPEPPAAKKAAPTAAPKKSAPAPAHTIACRGAFAKDSTHIKLATAFNSLNLTFTEVDGPERSKLMASVLFPKDPKRRLEVWWKNEAARSEIYLIVINGQSTWSGPKGVRLGLQPAALERLNGKPFKLKAFGKDKTSTVSDWDGGALETLPGSCKYGIRFVADAKVTADALSAVSGEGDLASTDAKVRAVKPTIDEILVGY